MLVGRGAYNRVVTERCACGEPLRDRAALAAELRAVIELLRAPEPAGVHPAYDRLEAAAVLVAGELEGRCRTCAAIEEWLDQEAP